MMKLNDRQQTKLSAMNYQQNQHFHDLLSHCSANITCKNNNFNFYYSIA